MKAFETFTLAGIRYLAMPVNRGNVGIVDENGGNHGSYMSIESFKKYRLKGETKIGTCSVTATNYKGLEE